MNQVCILEVRVDKISLSEAVDLIIGWIKKGGKHYVVTTNPEFVMAAQKDPEFRKVLNSSDLAIADGVGLKLGGDIQSNIAGIDLLERLCNESAEKGFTTGFLGGREGVAKRASECLQKKYSGLKVVLAEDGPEVDMNGNIARGPAARQPHPTSSLVTTSLRAIDGAPRLASPLTTIPPCDILFVAFGQVKQEKWIAKNLPHLPVKVAMGVGGSFDEISGKVPRIPGWIHRLGLKWLVRLLLQPWRIKRQTALIKFAWRVMLQKMCYSRK